MIECQKCGHFSHKKYECMGGIGDFCDCSFEKKPIRRDDLHYRNGREAKNGDKVVRLDFSTGRIEAFGVLNNATPGNEYCNGNILFAQPPDAYACMCDCLHVDDVAKLLVDAGWDKRPEGM